LSRSKVFIVHAALEIDVSKGSLRSLLFFPHLSQDTVKDVNIKRE